jgi:hypothetical protein
LVGPLLLLFGQQFNSTNAVGIIGTTTSSWSSPLLPWSSCLPLLPYTMSICCYR